MPSLLEKMSANPKIVDKNPRDSSLRLSQEKRWSKSFDRRWWMKRLMLLGGIVLFTAIGSFAMAYFWSDCTWSSLLWLSIQWTGLLSLALFPMFEMNRAWSKEAEKESLIRSAVIWKCRGDAFYELGQYQKAIEDYNRALNLDLKYVGAYIQRGSAFHKLRQYQDAIADLTTAIKLRKGATYKERDSECDSARLRLGDAYQEIGQYDKAIEEYGKAIFDREFAAVNLEPSGLDTGGEHVYLHRGDAFANLGLYQKAISDYSTAIEQYRERIENIGLEVDPDEAELDLAISYHAMCYARRASIHTALKQYQNAIEDYSNAIEIDSHSEDGSDWMHYLRRAELHERLGQLQNMLQDCESAVEMNPRVPKCYFMRGYAHSKCGYFQKAVDDYTVALESGDYYSDPIVYLYRGDAYLQLGQIEYAESDHEKAKQFKPRAEGKKAIVYELREGPYQDSGEHPESINLSPETVEAYERRAALERHRESIGKYSQKIARHPKNPWSYFMRGDAYRELGEHQKAINDYSAAIKMGYLLGFCDDQAVKLSRGKRAIEEYDKSICLSFCYANTINAAFLRRGDAYHATGEVSDAISDYSYATGSDMQTASEFAERRWHTADLNRTKVAI